MDDSDRLSALRGELQSRVGKERFELWFGSHLQLAFDNHALQVTCPSRTEMDWLRRKLAGVLQESCQAVWGRGVAVVFSVDESLGAQQRELQLSEEPSRKPVATSRQSHSPSRKPPRKSRGTFANFVPGDSNQLALATVQTVVQAPGRYSPLLLHGASGTGKTHLLEAAVAELRRLHPRRQTLKLTAEQFTAEFLEALSTRASAGFRHKFRSVDVLLVDDVHFLAGKKATLEEFLYTVEAILNRGGQVILTSAGAPNELATINPPLASRIAGGMSAPLDPPDYATRLGIVATMAARMKVELPKPVMEMIAQQAVGSARLLAGAINRLVAVSMAMKRPITTILAEVALREFCQQNTPQVRLGDIQRAVCDVFGMEAATLKSNKRSKHIVQPRALAMWLACRHTRAGLAEISEFFGRRSHSTVLSAQKKFDGMIGNNAELATAAGPCQAEEALRRVEAALRTA